MTENRKPFEITDEFYIAVGRMTVAWAAIEIPLDAVCGILFTRTNDAARYEQEIPRAFERKAAFCKKCFNNLPEVAKFKPAAEVIQRASDLSTVRHRLIHGLVDTSRQRPPAR